MIKNRPGCLIITILLPIIVAVTMSCIISNSDNSAYAQNPEFNFSELASQLSTISNSDKSASAQNSAFNFSDLSSDLGSSPNMDFGNLLSSIKSISGTYANPDFGFTIVFPPGWNGSEISFGATKSASVISPEIFENGLPPAIGVMFVDNSNGSALSTLSNATDMIVESASSGIGGGGDTSQVPQCKSTSVSQVNINGINSEQREFNCTNLPDLGGNAKIKSYTMVTNDDSLVTISFIGSEANYEKNLPLYEEAVKTVKLSNPGDVSNSATFNAYKTAVDKNMQ